MEKLTNSQFLVVGMYIEQICLAVLFFLKVSDGIIFIVEGILMIVLIGLTLTAQILYKRSFDRMFSDQLPYYVANFLCSYHPIPANVSCDEEDAGTMGE